MALEVSMTGSGTIGDVAPGWSVSESATAVAIGDRTAGTGSVSFNAKSTDDSLLVINNKSTSTFDGLGSLIGVVQSVSQSGLNCNITHGTALDSFNLDVSVPPVESGGARAWFYELGKAVFGDISAGPRPDYSIPLSTYSGSVKQYSYCFPFDNTSDDLTNLHSADTLFYNSTKSTDGSFGYSFSSAALPAWENFSSTTPMLPGIESSGNWYQPNPMLPDLWSAFEPYFDFMLDVDAATDVRLWIKSGETDGSPSYLNTVSLEIDGAAETVSVINVNDETTTTGDFSTLVNGDPLLFTFYNRNSSPFVVTPFNRFYYKVTNSAGSSITGYVDCYLSGILNFAGDYINCPKMYYFNAAYVLSYSGTYIVPEVKGYPFYIDFSEYTGAYEGAYPATSGIGWELIQDIAAAENFEVAISGETVYIRDIGLHTLDITNRTTPSINPASTLSGRQIDIAYTNAEFVSGVIYDAQADGNNEISVDAGETIITSVKGGVHPMTIIQPTRYLATIVDSKPKFVGPLPDGTYFISDSTGLPISENQWEDFGGFVSVVIDPEDNSAIQITVKGPNIQIPSTTAPYRLVADDGENTFAALKITGTGVSSGSNKLSLITAIDTSKYTRATVNTITNSFVRTEENAYDRGVWASMKASGPVVNVSFNVPVTAIDGIGLTPGALFDYNQSTYRVTSTSVGNLNVTINAERHVLVSDIDAIWGSQTVADHDSVWGSLECQDQIVFPYKVA